MSEPAPRGAPPLEMRDISKRFGSVQALDRVSLSVGVGSVHALLGENGAGKSTLMRVAFGLVRPDAGTVALFGRERPEWTVMDAQSAGVGMVQQHLSLIPTLSVAENFALGHRGLYRPKEVLRRLGEIELRSGLAVPRARRVSELSIVEQQRLEILKVLARGIRLLILDEPTAILAPSEIQDLLRWIRRFADAGGSVVLVTHKLQEALSVADFVTVLRRGALVRHAAASELSSETLARAMFGDEPTESLAPRPSAGSSTVLVSAVGLRLLDAHGTTRIRDATFELRSHEIVGVAAVEGSGHRELLAALAGLTAPAAGTLTVPSRRALIPADRLRDGLIPTFTLVENVALRDAARRRGVMPWSALVAKTIALVDRFAIAAPSPFVRAQDLSGGNQQRLVIGRELSDDVDLVIADNATRGLDLRATTFVHAQLRAAAARGAAVVVHSSDLDEVLSLASRVIVVFSGQVREAQVDREYVGRAMLGAG